MGATEVWDRNHRGLTIGLLATVAFSAFEALAVATILPTTVAEIGGLDLYGWAFSAFMLASLIGITAGGTQADERGPATPFLLGAAVFVAGLVGAGAASTMPWLVAARFVQGLGAGAVGAVSYVAVGRGYSPQARPRMIALLSSAWVVPGLVGPALAGLVADTLGWRWVFFALAPATTIGAAVAAPGLRRLAAPDRDDDAGRADRSRTWNALQLALGAGVLVGGLEREDVVTGAAVVLAGLAIGLPAARRLLPTGTLRIQPGPGAAVALVGLVGFAFFGAEAFIPLAITSVRGRSAVFAGLPLTVGTLTWTAGAWIQAREAPRRSRRTLVRLGFLLIAIGVAGTTTVLHPGVPLPVVGLAWGVTSLGMGLTYSTLTLVILESARGGEEGRASAALQLSYTLCIALGTGIGGALLAFSRSLGRDLATAIASVEVVMVATALVAAVLAGRMPDRVPNLDPGCKADSSL